MEASKQATLKKSGFIGAVNIYNAKVRVSLCK